jgi:hypothetical protein
MKRLRQQRTPVARIERQELDLGSFRQISRLINDKLTGLHSRPQGWQNCGSKATRSVASLVASSLKKSPKH